MTTANITTSDTAATVTATAAVAADTAAAVAEPPPLPSSLTVLGGAVIGGRTIAFGTLASRPRLWICTTTAAAATAEEKEQEEGPRVIGYLTGLVAGEPELWICDDNAWEWVNSTNVSVQLKAAAARVWDHCVRTCNG